VGRKKYSEHVNGSGPENSINEVPLWQKQCSVSGCHGETTVALITVGTPDSEKTRTAIFTDVGIVRQINHQSRLELRGNYQFIRWVTRCATCFMAESISTKSQQLNLPSDKAFVDSHRENLRRAQQ